MTQFSNSHLHSYVKCLSFFFEDSSVSRAFFSKSREMRRKSVISFVIYTCLLLTFIIFFLLTHSLNHTRLIKIFGFGEIARGFLVIRRGAFSRDEGESSLTNHTRPPALHIHIRLTNSLSTNSIWNCSLNTQRKRFYNQRTRDRHTQTQHEKHREPETLGKKIWRYDRFLVLHFRITTGKYQRRRVMRGRRMGSRSRV